jgi:hypothetical protein
MEMFGETSYIYSVPWGHVPQGGGRGDSRGDVSPCPLFGETWGDATPQGGGWPKRGTLGRPPLKRGTSGRPPPKRGTPGSPPQIFFAQ